MVAGHIHSVKYRATAVDSTALADKFERTEVVVKEHDCMGMCRRIDSTAEEDYTNWMVDTVVAAMTSDKVLAPDSAPPARGERIYS